MNVKKKTLNEKNDNVPSIIFLGLYIYIFFMLMFTLGSRLEITLI